MTPGTLITYQGRPGVIMRLVSPTQAIIKYSEFGRTVTCVVKINELKERK